MRTRAIAFFLLQAVSAAWPGEPATSDTRQLLAQRLPGQWVSVSDMERLVTLDFYRHSWTLRRLDRAASASLAGKPVYLAGTMRDSRVSQDLNTRILYVVTTKDNRLTVRLFPKTESTMPTDLAIEIVPSKRRRDDVLRVAIGRRGEWREFERARESIHVQNVAIAGPSDGVELDVRIDYATDFHTVLDSRLSWRTADEKNKRETVWEGLYALSCAVSSDTKQAAVVLAEIMGWTNDSEVVIVDLASGKETRTGHAAQGVTGLGSSSLPKPSLEWVNPETLLFTAGRGKMFNRRIVLLAYDTKTGKTTEFTEGTTSKTALLDPGHGHEFVRGEDGGWFFRVVVPDAVLYPLDVEKRTVGKAIVVPRKRAPKSWKVLSRELLEKTGRLR